MQRGCQNKETKKYVPNKRTEQNSIKIAKKKKETNNLLDADFKTLVVRMLNELSENFNHIKKSIWKP